MVDVVQCQLVADRFVGVVWKAKYWVRKVAALYSKIREVLRQRRLLSAISWFVFAMLGSYPINAATDVYVMGSPLVGHVNTHKSAYETTFTIVAENNSRRTCYPKCGTERKRAGPPLDYPCRYCRGGELHFRMGSKPNKEWASDPADCPPSGLIQR